MHHRLRAGLRAGGLAMALLLAAALPAAAAQPSQHAGGGHPARPAGCAPADIALRCAAVATPAFDPAGRLWLTWAAGGHVLVARSEDGGATFTAPVAVTPAPVPVDDNGENRPKLAAPGDGRVYITYTVKGKAPFSGDVRFSRSLDDGRSFSPPRSVSDEPAVTSLRFDALTVAPSGRLYVAWIDKRDGAAAKRAGRPYVGAAIYLAWSDDDGATFSANRVVQAHSCECCRLGLAVDADSLPVLVWRAVFGRNIRDHAVAKVDPATGLRGVTRLSVDDWAIDACPHHGPGLAIGAPGIWHATWYTEGAARQGAFYGRSEDGGATFSAPMALGDPQDAPTHPLVATLGSSQVFLAWKAFTGTQSAIHGMTSADGGRSWSAPALLAVTGDASDHPLLVSDGRRVYLSWLTASEGYRLLPLGERP